MANNDNQFGVQTLGLPKVAVKNTSGSAMTPGQAVKVDTSNPISNTQGVPGVVLTAAVTDEVDWIIAENIAAGAIGNAYATVDGQMLPCIAAGAISVGAQVGASGATSGDLTTYTAADPSFGKALQAASNPADIFLVLVKKSKNA